MSKIYILLIHKKIEEDFFEKDVIVFSFLFLDKYDYNLMCSRDMLTVRK